MIPVALLGAVASGCVDQQPTGPKLPSVARSSNVTFNQFFTAWSQGYGGGQIQTQVFALDTRQDRQYGGWWADETVLSFARANPGRLYIHGDEPDQWCTAPSEYAEMYHAFVEGVRRVDPTARFSPAGVAEPNDRCCPVAGDEACRASMHSVGYADQFYNAYVQRFGVAPRVDEWRFHDFGVTLPASDLEAWWSRVDRAAAWSVAHGAKMVLGAWGFHGWREPVPAFQEHMKQAMGRLLNDSRINGAVYWSYERWVESPRPLVNDDGSLTAEGQTYANPLTDIPTDLKIAGSADGQAKLRWTNTSWAWPAEVEFWVQAPGSNSFVYHKTERVGGLGATQSPFVDLDTNANVKARVRYYHAYGQAEWSPFSNTVSLALTAPETDQRKGRVKSPFFCLLQLC